jgi:hypothetical protein
MLTVVITTLITSGYRIGNEIVLLFCFFFNKKHWKNKTNLYLKKIYNTFTIATYIDEHEIVINPTELIHLI